MIKYFIGLSLAAGLLITACSKSTILGTEILDEDFVNVEYSDQTAMLIKNTRADSVRTFPTINQLFILGNIDDPVFGKSFTEVYAQLKKIYEAPLLQGAYLDSVVLSIGINRDGFWGDTLADHTLEIYELGESIDFYDTLYTSQQFSKGSLLGSRTFNPYTLDTSTVIIGTDTTQYQNIIRVALDKDFGNKLFLDTLALDNDTLLTELTNGLLMRSLVNGNSVIGINSGIYLDDYTNKLIFYYTQEGASKSHSITLGGKRGQYVSRDLSGSTVSDFIYNGDSNDSLLYISGLVNTNILIEIPDLTEWENKLINYAELEFYVAEPAESLPYEKIQQLYLYNRTESGKLALTTDLNISLTQNAPGYFGGSIKEVTDENGLNLQKYNINVTNELKSRITQNDTNTAMILSPYLTQGRANRSVLYGTGHSTYPAKLKITYTKQ